MTNIIWDDMAIKVLEKSQLSIKPLLEEFAQTHILVGGTAISLQLGHRKSIDFDLFSFGPQGTGEELMERIKNTGLKMDIEKSNLRRLSEKEESETTIFINDVKIQLIDFSRNPFDLKVEIESNKILCNGIKSVDLLTLGALKSYAMMYRAKLKDAIDLYFIIKSGVDFENIIKLTKEIFKRLYKPKYTYETIIEGKRDNTEEVDYIIQDPPTNKEVNRFLRLEVSKLVNKYI